MMKYLLFACATIYSGDKNPFDRSSMPDLAAQWATFNAHSEQSPKKVRRNRLSDDPEQIEEHKQECPAKLAAELRTIQQLLTDEVSQKKLEQLELACRVIAQAFMHFYDAHQGSQLQHCEPDVLEIAARIKLLQDSYWRTVSQELTERRKAAVPTYSIDELDQDLTIEQSKKDILIKLLLKKISEQETAQEIAKEIITDLARALRPYRKSHEEIITLINKLEQPFAAKRVKLSKKAIATFNGAAISEIQTEIKFLQLKDKHEYLQLEKAYTSVALLYLQAHDQGHPSGLAEAEKIMTGGIMSTIISWKTRHRMDTALEQYTQVWQEINKRKHAHTIPAGPGASLSSSHAASSSAS